MKTKTGLSVIIAAAAFYTPAMAQDSFGTPSQNNNQQPQHTQQGGYPSGSQQGGYQQPVNPQGQQQPGYYPPQNSNPQQQGAYLPQNSAPQGGYTPQQGYGHQGPQSAATPNAQHLDQLGQQERQDFGVHATNQLHTGAMHGPTPSSIPGGQLITTKGVAELVQGRNVPFLLLDILGGPEKLPGAIAAVPAHQAGSFNDRTQSEFGGFLQQATKGNKQMPIVLYCQSTQCWMSYNAALRAINMGYTNVLWYRGGIEAWKTAGFKAQPSQQNYSSQQQY